MSKKNRVAIYEQLFNEGVLVALKDTHAPKHPELPDIPNLQVRWTWALCLNILLRADQSRELTEILFKWKGYSGMLKLFTNSDF